MAHIRKRTLANGNLAYQLRYIDPNGKEKAEQFSRLKDANERLTEVENAKLSGTYVDRARGRMTFREYSEHWRSVQMYRELSAQTRERQLRLHVLPHIGSRALSSIRRSDVQGLAAKLNAKLAPNTVHGVMAVVGAVLSSAVLDGLIVTSPAVRIGLPDVPATQLAIPTVEQVRAATTAVPAHCVGLVWAAATTGLRRNELLGVTLESLDLLRRTVTVRPDRGQLRPGSPPALVPPKSRAGARVVPLGDVAVQRLSVHLSAFPADRGDGCGGLVFRSSRGRAWSSGGLAQALSPMGVKLPGGGAGLHLFRHFYASALIQAGESPKVVQIRLGHASIKETMDTYGHLWPDSDDRSRKAIDAIFAA